MNTSRISFFRMTRVLGLGLVLILSGGTVFAANPTVTEQVDPPEINVGEATNVTITIQNAGAGSFRFPQVDGLQFAGQSTSKAINIINGSMTTITSFTVCLVATKAGDFVIPAFDIPSDNNSKLRVQSMKVHVLTAATAPASPSPAAGAAAPSLPPVFPGANRNGPVVMPDPNAPTTGAAPVTDSGFKVPLGTDGRPVPVFIVVTAKTTDAYVGENVPLRIEFYIRGDSDYQQNSLPTIKGSDFLMNDLSVRPGEDVVTIMNDNYRRDTWITAISAPKPGDFPLQMERDTYWVKAQPGNNSFTDPFGNIFGPRPTVAHTAIPSNELIFHVHELPTEGRPDHFSGAIGQFKVLGTAEPSSVAVGDPVTVHFTVSGQGNFTYIKCPSFANDPAWKSYTPTSKVQYDDESRTQGTKTFEQALIPQKSGTLALPACNFSYFDPTAKQYVTTPISFAPITVTGADIATAPSLPTPVVTSADVSATPPATDDFLPNRLNAGAGRTSLAPVYDHPLFWIVQGLLVALLLAGCSLAMLKSLKPDPSDVAAQAERRRSMDKDDDAMSRAVRESDATTFFLAARHAIQLQLGTLWKLKPEAITLSEIRARDPQKADIVEPLFNQTDEIIYSGQSGSGPIDLAEWESRVRNEMLQLQPV